MVTTPRKQIDQKEEGEVQNKKDKCKKNNNENTLFFTTINLAALSPSTIANNMNTTRTVLINESRGYYAAGYGFSEERWVEILGIYWKLIFENE